MKFCTQCGHALEPGTRVCPSCGKAVHTAQRQQTSGQNTRSQYYPDMPAQNPPKSRGPVIFGIVAGVLVVTAVAAFAIVNLFAFSPNRHEDVLLEDPAPSAMGAPVPATAEDPSGQSVETTLEEAPHMDAEDAGSAAEAPQPEGQTLAQDMTPLSDVPYYVTGVANQIKLRESASTTSLVVGKLQNFDMVKLLDTSDSIYWEVLVEDEAYTGYIDSRYLTDEYEAVVSPYEMYVTGVPSYLGLINTPGADYELLGKSYNGDRLTVLAETDGDFWFVYVDPLRQYGYVMKDFLSNRVPAATPTPTPQSSTPTPQTVIVVPPAVTANPGTVSGYTMYVSGVDYYLALRTEKKYDERNEIGKIRNGEPVTVVDNTTGTYWYVYAPTLGKYGYVNSDYLVVASASTTANYRTVYGVDYYLALRTEKQYNERNEIGKIYNGETVQVIDSTTGTYWYVYAPTLGLYGYVNSDYLR